MPQKPKNDTPSVWFLFSENNLAISERSDGISLPTPEEIISIEFSREIPVGETEGKRYFCAEISTEAPLPEGIVLKDLRSLYGRLDESTYRLAGRAAQILNWDQTHRFCGRCGAQTYRSQTEFAMICPRCGLTSYPRISPAVIMAVMREDRILLGRHKGSEIYSVIAGYVEAGEALEESVKREVMEEVSVQVGNIRYFGNQPWAYSSSLVVAFTADWISGEIREDKVEIAEAHWFSSDSLPSIPRTGSISREIIDWFARTHPHG
ncbi:MAG: NAD(+) diphosphatase [Chitinispirillaceae bacterium]